MTFMGAAALAPLGFATKLFSDVGSELFDMSARTGLSVEALGELGHAAKQSGADVGALEIGSKRMSQFLVDAAGGSAEAQDQLGMLGLSLKSLLALPADKRLESLGLAISKLPDEALQADAAMKIFGRNGTALLPMFAEGASGLAAMRAEAVKLGRPTTEQAKAADALGDALTALRTSLKSIVFVIGGALAPIIQQAAQFFTGIAQQVRVFIQKNSGLVKGLFLGVAGFTALGVAVLAFGKAFSILGSVLSIVAVGFKVIIGLFSLLVSWPGLIVAGLVALTAWFLTSTQTGGKVLKWLGDKFKGLLDTARTAFAGIADALKAGDMRLAAQILWTALKLGWQQVLVALAEGWNNFVSTKFGQGVMDAVEIAVKGWFALRVAWTETLTFLRQGWVMFAHWWKTNTADLTGWIAKQMAWIAKKLGFFEDISLEQLTGEIDRITAQEKKDLERQPPDEEIAAIEAERVKKLEALKTQRENVLAALQRHRERGIDTKPLEAEAARLQGELLKLREAARKAAEAVEKHGRAAETANEKLGVAMSTIFSSALAGIGSTVATGIVTGVGMIPKELQSKKLEAGLDAMRKVETRGTFGAAGLRGLGFGETLQERQAQALDDIKKTNAEIARNTKKQAQFA